MPSPNDALRSIAVLGSTGTIGVNTLEVVAASEGRFRPVVLTCGRNVALAVEQARRFRPRLLVVADPEAAPRLDRSMLPPETEVRVGPEAVVEAAALPEVDTVVAAIVGCAGLPGVWAALDAGKTVALANKESLVVAGARMMDLVRRRGGTILPVDSEHSAVFQALQCGRRQDVRRVVLTASGGPFRTFSREQMETVTPAMALKHPTWVMGSKTTIDSATMMNKALELIEARWLFDLDPAAQLAVSVHPQSIVHSLVEFVDGSVLAQMSPPDMKLPIQYALTYPERRPGPTAKTDWSKLFELRFEPPDPERFPAIPLGLETAARGGSAGAVVNAANEVAVRFFLEGKLRFVDIVSATRAILDAHDYEPDPELDRLLAFDRWARQEVIRWIGMR